MEEELPVGLNEQVISMLENVVNESRRLREMIRDFKIRGRDGV